MLQLLIDVVVYAALGLTLVWVVREVLAGVRPAGASGWAVLRSRGGWRRLRWAHDRVVTAVLLAATVYALALVLGSPFKGMADNGDDERQMYQLGIAAPASHPLSSGYVTEYYRTGLTRAQLPIPASLAHSSFLFHYYLGYPTSALPLIRLALLGHDLFGGRLLDLRWVGFVNVSVVLLGLAALAIASRQLPRTARWVAMAIAALAFTDPGYLLPMNSFLSEPSSIGFGVLAVGAAGAVGVAGYRRLAFASFVLATCAFSFALTGDALVALPLALAAVPLAWRASRSPSLAAVGGGASPTAARSAGRFQGLAATGAVAILATAVLSIRGDLPYFTAIHEYDGVFSGILAHTAHPTQALRALGLPISLAKYAGFAAFYRAKSAFAAPFIHREFFTHISLFAIVGFYVTHPLEFLRLCEYGAGLAMHLRLHYLANFAPGGPTGPYAINSPWTLVHRDLLPHSLVFIVGVVVVALALALHWGRAQWRQRSGTPGGAAPEVLAAVAIGALIAFVEPLVAEGNVELVKHEVVFNVFLDALLAVLLGLAVAAGQWLLTGRRPSPVGLPAGIDVHQRANRGARPAVDREHARMTVGVVHDAPAPVAHDAPAPVAHDAPAPVAHDAPAPVVHDAPAPVAHDAPAPQLSVLCPICDAEVPRESLAASTGGWLLSCPACGMRTRIGGRPGSATGAPPATG